MASSIRSGLVSITFRQLSVPQIIDVASKAGLAGIEWGGDVHVPPGDTTAAADARRRTEAAGMAVAAYGSYYRAAASPAEEFDAVLASAKALGAPTIRIWAGKTGSAEADDGHWHRVTADIARISDLAAGAGITLTIEYHGGTLTDTYSTTLRLLDAVDRPNLLSGWQPRDGKSAEEGAVEIRGLRSRLGNLHVFQWWPTGKTRYPLADGTDRWATYLQTAAEDGVDRFALLEFVAGDRPEQLIDDAATLNRLLADIP